MKNLVVTGTDTGVGKTVAAAMLTLVLGGIYWKPIQAGGEHRTDTEAVAALTGLPASHFLRERYVLKAPLSPHLAAEAEGVEIDPEQLVLPEAGPAGQWLIVEGAGGLMVPITRNLLQIDLFARWRAPVVLCARTTLGTINHCLLSIEALRRRDIPVLGIVFVGDEMAESERTISETANVRRLGRLPAMKELDAEVLREAFAAQFDRRDFEAAHAG